VLFSGAAAGCSWWRVEEKGKEKKRIERAKEDGRFAGERCAGAAGH
jgi:hypothetical protein